MRMDSTFPTMDADGKESTDNDTNRDLTGPPNNVITRSNGNNNSQIPPRSGQASPPSPTAIDPLPGAPSHSPPPSGILPWPTGRGNVCETPFSATSGPPPDRASIDDTPISPTSHQAPREPPVRPTVRLPSQTFAQANMNTRSTFEEIAVSPMSGAAPPTQSRLPPLPQTSTAVNTNDRSDDVVEPESAVSPTTTLQEQASMRNVSTLGDEAAAANTLMMLAGADLSSRSQDTTAEAQTPATASRDFAVEPIPANDDAPAPPNEPSINPQERSDPSSGSGMSALRMPQPAQHVLSSDSSPVVSSPARQVINASRRIGAAQPAVEIRPRPYVPSRHQQSGRSTPDMRHAIPTPQMSPGQRWWARRDRTQKLRDDSIHLAQKIRLKFAPSSPGADEIRRYVALLDHNAAAADRERARRGFYVPAPMAEIMHPPPDAAPMRSRYTRRQEIAELRWQSEQLQCRILMRFATEEPPQQTRNRIERAASVEHAAELERRLSIQFGDIDLPTDTSSSSRSFSRASSWPSRYRSPSRSRLRPDATPFIPPARLNGRRTRSASPTPSELFGRTPLPVIVDGRTVEQRLRDPLPDTSRFHAAVNGNPAGTYSPNPSEGEAGPSTYRQPRSRDQSVPAPLILGSPEEAPKQRDDDSSTILRPGPNNKGKSPLRKSRSPTCGQASSSTRKARSQPPATSPPALPHPYQPLDSQGLRLKLFGKSPYRLVEPIAAVVPGQSNPMHPATPPPPTALRERRLDEHSRLLDHGLSDGEGSERVIASSSSGQENAEGDEKFDLDDEDSGEA